MCPWPIYPWHSDLTLSSQPLFPSATNAVLRNAGDACKLQCRNYLEVQYSGFWEFGLVQGGDPHTTCESTNQQPIHSSMGCRVHQIQLRAWGARVGVGCRWGIPELPELNFDNPGVRAHILAAGKHWLDAGCAGWRLDAPTRVPGTFWSHFRRTCKEARPDAYLVRRRALQQCGASMTIVDRVGGGNGSSGLGFRV